MHTPLGKSDVLEWFHIRDGKLTTSAHIYAQLNRLASLSCECTRIFTPVDFSFPSWKKAFFEILYKRNAAEMRLKSMKVVLMLNKLWD